jgi:hypothetical protein
MRDINSEEYFKEIVRINEAKKEALKQEFPHIYNLVYGKERRGGEDVL